jgi:hypothetical protein
VAAEEEDTKKRMNPSATGNESKWRRGAGVNKKLTTLAQFCEDEYGPGLKQEPEINTRADQERTKTSDFCTTKSNTQPDVNWKYFIGIQTEFTSDPRRSPPSLPLLISTRI